MQSLRWVLIILALVSGACSPWPNPVPEDNWDDLDIGDGAGRGEEVSRKVTAKAAVTLELKTGAQVKIPKGAVDKDVTITLKRPKDKEAVKLVENVESRYKLASAPYVITPHGTKFKADVEVTLPIAEDRNSNKVKVLWRKDEEDLEWKELSAPKVSKQKATVKVDHFSLFLLVEERSYEDGGYYGDRDYGDGNYGDGDYGDGNYGDGDYYGDGNTSGSQFAVARVVGPEGGRLELETPEGVATLVVPPGALSQTTTLSLERRLGDQGSGLGGSGLGSPLPGLTEEELDSLIISDVYGSLFGPGFVGFTTTQVVFSVEPQMVFALPVTLQIPLSEGDDVLVRTTPNFTGAYLVPRASIANGRGTVTTRRSGAFAALSSSTRTQAVARARTPHAQCLLRRATDYSQPAAACVFENGCSTRISCTATGSCTCSGGALAEASFQGSCASGVAALAAQAAEACEWSGVVPYLPENEWWEIHNAADTSTCAPGDDFDVGSYAWTGSDGYQFSSNWESSWTSVSVDAIVANTGARVDAFEDGCLRYQRTDEAPCPEPAGLVSGPTTRITLSSAGHSETSVYLSFQTNQVRGLPPDSFRESWSLDCWDYSEPAQASCSCTRSHVGGGADSVYFSPLNPSLTGQAARRIALSSETPSDVQRIFSDCGWPQVEYLPSRQYTRPASGTTMPSVAPMCFAP